LALKIKKHAMKRFNFLSVVIALVLVVAAIGCSPLTEADRDRYNERPASAAGRIYVDDPYRGTVVLERDPYTGRYYEVSSYGSYNSRYYRGGYDPYYNDRNYSRDRRVYRTPRQTTQPQQPTQEQIKQQQKNKEEARKRVLGN
jgi:hypothetical protein